MSETFTSTAQKIVSQLQLMASSMALLAIVCGLILFVMWGKSGIPKQLTGRQRLTRIPWDWLEVFLAVLFFVFLLESIVKTIPWGKHPLPAQAYTCLEATTVAHVFPLPCDGNLYTRFSVGLINSLGAIQIVPLELDRQTEESRSRALHLMVVFPLLLVFFLYLMRRLAGTRLYQLGLHLNRWKENFTLGTAVWVIVVPVCTVVFLIVLLDFWETLWGRKASHPMAMLLERDPRMSTWLLVGIVTCVIAPLKEEILMRGVLQPFLMRNSLTSDVLVIFSIVWAFVLLMSPGSGPDRGIGMGPLLYVAVIAPGYYLFEKWTERWITEPGAARGIFATSLIFAALHVAAWPQPIPLFLFSLAVGFLAYRTRSLIGPITVHILFNLTTMVSLLLETYPKFKW